MTGSAAAVELRRGVGVAPVMVQVVQVAGREEDVAARASRRDHDRLARGPGSQIQSPFSDRALNSNFERNLSSRDSRRPVCSSPS